MTDEHQAVETAPEWPFDADQSHPLAARRIPVVSHIHPSWKYEVCVCISDSDLPWKGYEPTPAEADLIESYLEYRMEYYNKSWRAKMRERPLDVDGSTNTTVLLKDSEGFWHHRRRMWTGSSMWPPLYGEDRPRMTLAELLDRINTIAGELYRDWAEWKRTHPEVFTTAEQFAPDAEATAP